MDMLKRSKILVAFLVVTVLCASIGFAAASDTLKVDGSWAFNATNDELVSQFDDNIKFTSVVVGTDVAQLAADEAVAKIVDVDTDNKSDKLTITLANTVLQAEGDKYYVKATVTNSNKADAAIALATAGITNAYNDNISISVTGGTAKGDGGTCDVLITFELVKAPSEDITAEQGTFSFEITATSTDTAA